MPNPPTASVSQLECNLVVPLHRKYSSSDCTGTLASTTQIIADECVQIGKEGQIGSYMWRARTGRQKAVFFGQYEDKNCEIGVSPTESPNIFVLEGCYEPLGKLECLGNDLKLIAQKAGGSNCSETEVFRVFESVENACVSAAAVRFKLSSMHLSIGVGVFLHVILHFYQ